MFVAFDVLAVAGRDIRRLPWRDRWRELEALLGGGQGLVRITPVLEPDLRLHHGLVADGRQGTVAPRLSSRYRCGRRSDDWVKLKSPDSVARDRARVRRGCVGPCSHRRRNLSGSAPTKVADANQLAGNLTVEFGKALATRIAEELRADRPEPAHDSSTNALIERYRAAAGRGG